MRRILVAAASIAVIIGAVGLAPSALASDESAQFSSLASGVAVSGISSSTVTPGYSDGYVWAVIDFPTALFSTQTWTGSVPSKCDTYGITLALNGTPLTIQECRSNIGSNFGTDIVYLNVHSVTMPDPVAGDVITISWGSSYTTTVAPLAGQTIYVWDSTSNTSVDVTPTLLSPSGGGSPMPMWQQAVGRESSTASCPDGYAGSWDAWPNGGKGGYVCNRFVPVYGN